MDLSKDNRGKLQTKKIISQTPSKTFLRVLWFCGFKDENFVFNGFAVDVLNDRFAIDGSEDFFGLFEGIKAEVGRNFFKEKKSIDLF
ncbi:MAG: hypothetical protein LBG52_04640 [Candidatus Peribacteria bacterium]|jgi:hypothetical protein|nr:hypothetical protein [Candidatus Peribacteria bacterium]